MMKTKVLLLVAVLLLVIADVSQAGGRCGRWGGGGYWGGGRRVGRWWLLGWRTLLGWRMGRLGARVWRQLRCAYTGLSHCLCYAALLCDLRATDARACSSTPSQARLLSRSG